MSEAGVQLERLPRAAARRRDELEGAIERLRGALVEAGAALAEIRNDRLYRDTHETFDAYVEERWDLTRQRAYQLIDAAVVSTVVDIDNERQARVLAPLLRRHGEEAVREVVARLGQEPRTEERLRQAREDYEEEYAETGPARRTGGRRRVELPWRVAKVVIHTQYLSATTQGWPELQVSVDVDDDLHRWLREAAQQQGVTHEKGGEVSLDLPELRRALLDAVLFGRWDEPGARDFACLLARVLVAEGMRGPKVGREPTDAT